MKKKERKGGRGGASEGEKQSTNGMSQQTHKTKGKGRIEGGTEAVRRRKGSSSFA
jgi:hypothetical protein